MPRSGLQLAESTAGVSRRKAPAIQRTGRYTHHATCRFCHAGGLVPFLDFGRVPLAGAFLRAEQIASEKVYPLEVCFCERCLLVQVNNAVPGDVLFRDYFFFSSVMKTLVDHFEALAEEVCERFHAGERSLAVEIGCNDGVLLKPLAARGVRCVGVDPATNVVQSVASQKFKIINDFFGERVAQQIRKVHGQADVILSSYSFAHIDDMDDVMRGIQALLKPEGVLIVDIYYLPNLIEGLQYDMIYHEHLNYYSLMALKNFFARFEMEVFDVKDIPGVRGGTVRFYVRRAGSRRHAMRPSVARVLAKEQAMDLDRVETYQAFAKRVYESKAELLALLRRLKRRGHRIVGYGASGRSTTMMNFCGIDRRFLDYVVDDTPAKQGCYTPGTHLLIRPWSATREARPDYTLLFAWSFIDEVMRRCADYVQQGGKFIVPLPKVSLVPE